jgi:hypothetical protein
MTQKIIIESVDNGYVISMVGTRSASEGISNRKVIEARGTEEELMQDLLQAVFYELHNPAMMEGKSALACTIFNPDTVEVTETEGGL